MLQNSCKNVLLKTQYVVVLFFTFMNTVAFSQSNKMNDSLTIFTFELKEEIAPSAFRTVTKAFEHAELAQADYIIMELNTYGGLVDMADSIRTKIMNCTIPTISFINNNAASAGALISIACDQIYMADGASIGASTVVNQTGEQAPDKYQSYMRSTMRSTAEAKNRNPRIAEAMVDARISIPNVTDSGKVVTFTPTEAMRNGFCEGQANSIHEIITDYLKIEHYKIKTYKKSSFEKLISFLLNPMVSSVLMFMMIGGIWYEIQSPGIGFPLIAAVIGATFYFMPLYLEGLVENWEILLLLIGILLLIAEVFILPGFGIAGILGFSCILIALTFSLIDNDLFNWDNHGIELISFPLFRVLLTLLFIVIFTFVFMPVLFKNSRFKHLALETEASQEKGYTVLEKGLKELIGKQGTVINELKPMGRIQVNNKIYTARSISGWVDVNEQVDILDVDVNNFIVKKSIS